MNMVATPLEGLGLHHPMEEGRKASEGMSPGEKGAELT
jgi:hypothetical protein